MNPAWVQHLLALGMLLGAGHASSSATDTWCYTDPKCGPATWGALGQCNGLKQSPININTSAAVPNAQLDALSLTGYEDGEKLSSMENNGKTVYVHVEDGLRLRGQGLPYVYTAQSFHLHWGEGKQKPGSEHLISDKQFDMELHIVHTKNNLNTSDALQDPQGVAVLAFFLQASDQADSSDAWDSFTQCLKKVPVERNTVHLDDVFSLSDLLGPVDLARYYRYKGSLTTPNCTEAVIWTVFPDPILVSPDVVDAFPSILRSKDGSKLYNNFRPVQSLGDRQVQASAALQNSHSASPALHPAALLLLLLSTAALIWHL
ncbi:carbonic anhydrase 4-like [Carettochelys insculpta]|uniref:carbonic anhydrase 4-like n=1 Tax=Carettochelys insculpta TaxID=44489 RepID=UPI003EB72B2F